MRGGSAARQLPRDFALLRVLAALVIAECDRPGADAVLAPRRRETPAISDSLLGIRLGTFGRMEMPPPAAGADEFGSYGHRSSFRSFAAFNHYFFVPLNSPEQKGHSFNAVNEQAVAMPTPLFGLGVARARHC